MFQSFRFSNTAKRSITSIPQSTDKENDQHTQSNPNLNLNHPHSLSNLCPVSKLRQHHHLPRPKVESALSKLKRLLHIIRDARSLSPKPVPVHLVKGPLTSSTHLVDSVNENDGTPGDDPILITSSSLTLIHGMSKLLLSRRTHRKQIDAHFVCNDCVGLSDFGSLLILAAQMQSNASVPYSFLKYTCHVANDDGRVGQWVMNHAYVLHGTVSKVKRVGDGKKRSGECIVDVYANDVLSLGTMSAKQGIAMKSVPTSPISIYYDDDGDDGNDDDDDDDGGRDSQFCHVSMERCKSMY